MSDNTRIEWATSTFEKFISNIAHGENGCWEWKAGLFSNGYGQFRIGKKKYRAHRLMWSFIHGEIPDGRIICHRCDNPKCCRPSHLFIGTNRDNARDRDSKGRGARGKNPRKGRKGENNHQSKLNRYSVTVIREKWEQGEHTQRELAESFGVSKSQIANIVKKRSWRHI